MTTIGVVIATRGRASILRTLQSISYQGLYKGDDILVVGDGLNAPTRDIVEVFGPPFRYIATGQTGDWGHSQVNYGIKKVGGDVVVIQDDDDIFAPRAFEQIRWLYSEHPGVPMIGRTKTPTLGLLWSEPGTKTLLDGHCLVAPNDKEKLGYFAADYSGDQCYIAKTVQHYAEINWVDRVWTLTRPTWKITPSRSPAPSAYADAFHDEFVYRLPSVEGRETKGLKDWSWVFYTEDRVPPHPAAALRMFEDGDRLWATMAYCDNSVLEDVVEFAAWAGQGRDVWFGTCADDPELIAVLVKKGFQDHMMGKKNADFVLSWPPKWFPFHVLHEIRDENGVHLPDWRDQW